MLLGAAIVVSMAAYKWVDGIPGGETASTPETIPSLQFSPESSTPQAGRTEKSGQCSSDEDCPLGRHCRFEQCRRRTASLRLFDTCAYNDECPIGAACVGLRCHSLRRARTGPDYEATGTDWPQFRGPARDAVSQEHGLLRTWPPGGPPQLWSTAALGLGFGHPAIARGRVYVMGMYVSEGRVTALDLDGRKLWQTAYGPEWRRGSFQGARQTPTVDDGRLFLASGNGVLYALDANAGETLWHQDLFGQDPAGIPQEGYADSPLVVDGKVIILVGSQSRLAAAFSPETGELVWESPGGPLRHAYGTLVLVDWRDRQLAVGLVQQGLVAIDVQTGELVWLDDIPEVKLDYVATGARRTFASPPIHKDGEVVRTMIDFERGAMIGARKIRLDPAGQHPKTIWSQPLFGVHYSGAALWDNTLYGVASFDRRATDPRLEDVDIALMAVDWETGEVVGTLPFDHIGKSPLIVADGLIIAYGRRGDVTLLQVNRSSMKISGQLRVAFGEARHMTYPALSDGVLYIRHNSGMVAYDIRIPTATSR